MRRIFSFSQFSMGACSPSQYSVGTLCASLGCQLASSRTAGARFCPQSAQAPTPPQPQWSMRFAVSACLRFSRKLNHRQASLTALGRLPRFA